MSATAPIGYVLKRYPRYSETFVVNEILALEERGVPITIFSLRPPEDGHFQDAIARVRAPVAYHMAAGLRADDLWTAIAQAGAVIPDVESRLATARGMDVRHVWQALRIAREVRRQGLVHLHAHFATEATEVARLAAHFADVPFSFTAHAKDIFHESVVPAVLAAKLRAARRVVTVSDFNQRYLRDLAGDVAVARVYNGLPLDEFAYEDPVARAPQVLAIGRLVEKKGFSVLLDASAELVRRGVAHRVSVLGGGPLAPDLEAQIARLDLGAVVTLLGPRPRPEVMRQLREAAVLAVPCIEAADGNRDGLPTVLLEAMALGTPCVSTGVTGIPEIVRDGETGLLVAEGESAPLADALARLLGDATLRVRLARAARRAIERDFDVRKNAALLPALFGIEAPVARRAGAMG